MAEQPINFDDIKRYQANLDNDKHSKAIQRTVSHEGLMAPSADYNSDKNMTPVFSLELDTGDVTDQKQSGRCWMFAALNTMRFDIANNYNLSKKFQLSQNYTNFWDKFEKSNYFLENIIKTADQPLDSRKVSFLLETPQQDGGQWDMLCAIIEKYGVVPNSAMPETHNSNSSDELNELLNGKLRKNAKVLRQMVQDKATPEAIQAKKDEMLNQVYKILSYSLGTPPKHFNFEYRDKKHKYHIDKDITPKEFFKKYVNTDLKNYISIINSPTKDKPYNKTYTVDMLGNVVNGRPVKHLNLPISELKKLAIDQLKNGESVWFGSDVGKSSQTKKGIMDPNYYHPEDLLDTDLSMSKEDRLNYKDSLMTHAMVITGVDLVDGKPTKWKVQNSWGDKVGKKGYFTMSDKWFDNFVYQIVTNKKYLSAQQQKDQNTKPKELAPWDPMGSLA